MHLQPYKGPSTRHPCPACKTRQSFTLYVYKTTNTPIHPTVGKCNREIKCGYHHTPKSFFGIFVQTRHAASLHAASLHAASLHAASLHAASLHAASLHAASLQAASLHTAPLHTIIGTIPHHYLQNSISHQSHFIHFLSKFLTVDQIKQAVDNYALGATKSGAIIFWQIDREAKVRTGKIMQYNPITGRRVKHQQGAIDWVHNRLKKTGILPQEYYLQQCFFGEHLLKKHPDKPIAIVESEKSALIASSLRPDYIWLAAGNINGLSVEKCKVLKNRSVILYPDLGAYEKWSLKAMEIQKTYQCKVIVSTLLETQANETDREKGLDIADFILAELVISD